MMNFEMLENNTKGTVIRSLVLVVRAAMPSRI